MEDEKTSEQAQEPSDATPEEAMNPVDAYRRNNLLQEAVISDVEPTVEHDNVSDSRYKSRRKEQRDGRHVRADVMLELPYGNQTIEESLEPDEVDTLLEARGYNPATASVHDLVGEPVDIKEKRADNTWTMDDPSSMLVGEEEQEGASEQDDVEDTLSPLENALGSLHVPVALCWVFGATFGILTSAMLFIGAASFFGTFTLHLLSFLAVTLVAHSLLTVVRSRIHEARMAAGNVDADDAAPYIREYFEHKDDWSTARRLLYFTIFQ